MLEVPGVSIDVYEPFFNEPCIIFMNNDGIDISIIMYHHYHNMRRRPLFFCVRYFHEEYKMGGSVV